MEKILVGCDPEVFVKQGGRFVSAHNLIPGTKEAPFKVEKGAVQVDGFALEFNIDPAASEDEFCINVNHVFNTLKLMVPNHEIHTVPVAEFGFEYMEQQPAESLILGCDPDFNAWEQCENQKPNAKVDFRTASGHVHIGWTQGKDVWDMKHMEHCAEITKQMDFMLGLASLVYDDDVKRRTLYGKAGCFRPKPYGTEYRTLSNAWLKSDSLMRWVYRNVVDGMQRFNAGDILAKKYGDIQHIINNSLIDDAMFIINKENIEVPNV